MKREEEYVLEDTPEGRTLVVTGAWSSNAAKALTRGEANGLVLNYARGFAGRDLEFLYDGLGVRRLNVLDRGISDLSPISRLAESLEDLSVQAAQGAELDLGALPQLRAVAGEWGLLRGTLGEVDELQSVITWRFDEVDLHAFRDHFDLRQLTIKEAPHLELLAGIGDLSELQELKIFLAHRLRDISDIAALVSLRELWFEKCRGIASIDDVERLVNLEFLGFAHCGQIESLTPIESLKKLEVLYAYESTRITDGDLSPLTRLPRLREVRMRDRADYRPRMRDLVDENLQLRTRSAT
jgi:hypothetical protein